MFGMGIVMHENKIRPRRSTGAVNERENASLHPRRASEGIRKCGRLLNRSRRLLAWD
jgi:hypothetical protein